MKVRNFYKNGIEIKGLKEINLPKEKQEQVIRILYKEVKHGRRIRNKRIEMQSV